MHAIFYYLWTATNYIICQTVPGIHWLHLGIFHKGLSAKTRYFCTFERHNVRRGFFYYPDTSGLHSPLSLIQDLSELYTNTKALIVQEFFQTSSWGFTIYIILHTAQAHRHLFCMVCFQHMFTDSLVISIFISYT